MIEQESPKKFVLSLVLSIFPFKNMTLPKNIEHRTKIHLSLIYIFYTHIFLYFTLFFHCNIDNVLLFYKNA